MARLLMALLLTNMLIGSSISQASIQIPRPAPTWVHKAYKIQETPIDNYVAPSVHLSDTTYDTGVSFEVIQSLEGFTDSLHWPRGESGPTIGCGIDLGNIGKSSIRKIFSNVVGRDTLNLLLRAANIHGSQAEAFTRKNHKLRLTKAQISAANKNMLVLMWKTLVIKFPGIDSAPATVKTAVFSVALHRGMYNQHIQCLKTPIAHRDWARVASMIAAMPAPEGMAGVAKRRALEAKLIRQRTFAYDPD